MTVRLITGTDDYRGMTQRDLAMARRISGVAREMGIPADPTAVQTPVWVPPEQAEARVAAALRPRVAGSSETSSRPRGGRWQMQPGTRPTSRRRRAATRRCQPRSASMSARIASGFVAGL